MNDEIVIGLLKITFFLVLGWSVNPILYSFLLVETEAVMSTYNDSHSRVTVLSEKYVPEIKTRFFWKASVLDVKGKGAPKANLKCIL